MRICQDSFSPLCSFNAVPLLAEVAVNQALKHYEIADLVDTLKMDRFEMKAQPQTRKSVLSNVCVRFHVQSVIARPYYYAYVLCVLGVMELLHSAAYRQGGLGNSLFSPKYMIGKHSSEMVSGRRSCICRYLVDSIIIDF